MAWVMYAYVNTSSESELDYIVSALSPVIVNEHQIDSVVSRKLIKMCCREIIQGKMLSARMRAVVLDIRITTYHDNKEKYNNVIAGIYNIIHIIEKSSLVKIEKNTN